MPTPATTTPTPEAEFDPLVFWIQHQSKILLFAVLFVVALGAYGISEHLRNKRIAAAESSLAASHTVDDYRKLISEYAGTAPAGDAHLLLAEKLRAEGKFDESAAILHSFIEKYPEHPLLSGAWTSLGATLEAQGKVDEALGAYQKVSTAYANSFSAPLALLGQARLLAQKGKP
jgi:tetratricopeptide (TPR) repeat protein